MAIEQWLIDSPKTIDLEVVRRVRASLMAGSLDVIAHDEPGTRVEVSAVEGRDLKVAIEGDTLLIDHPQLGWGDLGASARTVINQPQARVSVLVPKSVDLTVNATSADVLVVGLDGDVSITTVGGEHFCDRTGGKLSLTSAAGELSVREHRGAVDATSATGDVTVTGPITSFNGNTISGSTVVDVSGSRPDRIAHTSVSGAVTVRLPEDAVPVCTITTVTSKAQLGATIVEPLFGRTHRTGTAAEEGGAYTDVRLSTVAGRIVVLREGEGLPGDAHSAAHRAPMNPNIDFANAPRPTRTPPPAGDDSAAGSAAAASWASAPAPTGEGTPPEGHTPFEPGEVRTASAAEPTASDAAADAAGTPTGDAERAADDDEGTDR